MLEVKNLHVEIDGKKILNGLDLTVRPGEVAAIMGPNGSGKSTLSYVIAGRDDYEVTEGEVLLDGENMLEMRARGARRQGAVPGLPVSRRDPGRRHHDVPEGLAERAAQGARRGRAVDPRLHAARARTAQGKLEVNPDMLKRPLNVGFSGGEKKRMEILQMALLEPRYGLLDETDSGLDIDALRIVANGVNALRAANRGFLVITHYQRLLDYIVPDTVHIMSKGRIMRSGDAALALELEKNGYRDYVADAA